MLQNLRLYAISSLQITFRLFITPQSFAIVHAVIARSHPLRFPCVCTPPRLRSHRTQCPGPLYGQTNPQGSFTRPPAIGQTTTHAKQTTAARSVCAGEDVMGKLGSRGQWQGGAEGTRVRPVVLRLFIFVSEQ